MKLRLLSFILGCLVWWPLASYGDQDLQARFEKSLKDARSITNVEIEWLDTFTLKNPAMLKGMKINKPVFSRTFQYSFIASGQKYRASDKLISGTETNLVKSSESAFDGTTYYTYRAVTGAMTKSSMNAPTEGLSPFNPLIEPFAFLTKYSDDDKVRILRFTDVTLEDFAGELTLPKAQRSNDVLLISMPGRQIRKQPTTWEITIGVSGDAFTPKTMRWVSPGQGMESITQLLNYTNLGTYQFPSRIEWTLSSYPPTSPPTIISTGSVTLISARIPGQIADSVFELEDEAKSMTSMWDWDKNNFTDAAHEEAKRYAAAHPKPKIYDESADGSKQIAAALATAKKENKHVLLEFGANYCGPCHVMHTFFETDTNVSEELSRDYVIVMVDVNKGRNQNTDAKYGNPTRFGIPVIVILNSEDKQLTTQNPGELEEGNSYSSGKVMAFLKEWSPKK